METMGDLRAERNRLRAACATTYSPDHFPGTAGWILQVEAERAFAAFDRVHPEVVAAIRAEKQASANQ